jgi:hypothetical protein
MAQTQKSAYKDRAASLENGYNEAEDKDKWLAEKGFRRQPNRKRRKTAKAAGTFVFVRILNGTISVQKLAMALMNSHRRPEQQRLAP